MLTDEQCDEFRMLPMPFNDMVRAIYRSGYLDGERSGYLDGERAGLKTALEALDRGVGNDQKAKP